MTIPFYQVDAFTDRLFGGNPAGVCPLEQWLPDETMQKIAMENNVSETAFFIKKGAWLQHRASTLALWIMFVMTAVHRRKKQQKGIITRTVI